ncbi:hypothetical protein AVEN_74409-1 [Araneus ventricosus]|uniref:Uncharacterized protein n=1 Tax=Araneus ventricosus TaxID=182803 RepID=A0A4Y2J675_ARAVE|nr:hypothetical protein AVEN_74409-1 [Araneus ventricosus]
MQSYNFFIVQDSTPGEKTIICKEDITRESFIESPVEGSSVALTFETCSFHDGRSDFRFLGRCLGSLDNLMFLNIQLRSDHPCLSIEM